MKCPVLCCCHPFLQNKPTCRVNRKREAALAIKEHVVWLCSAVVFINMTFHQRK